MEVENMKRCVRCEREYPDWLFIKVGFDKHICVECGTEIVKTVWGDT